MRTAFGYLRVSGKSQVEGDGFDRQVEAIRKYAAAHDIEIVRFYYEKGVTGKTDLEDRPALKEMVLHLLSNGTRLVLIERLDRLARFLMYQESILQDLKRKGIEMISVTEPEMCSDDPTRVLMRQVLGAFFEYERTCIVNKTRAARERIRNQGLRCEGRKPYGHHPDYPAEVALVERIIKMRTDGRTLTSIGDELNREGIKTRSGGLWYPNQVQRVLRQDP